MDMLGGALLLAIAVAVLSYAFTGNRRFVGGVLLLGLLLVLGAGFLQMMRGDGLRRPLVELGPRRQPVNSAQLGPAATTRLFGVQAKGHSIVYVIDGSASMGDGEHNAPLARIKKPIQHSVTDLQRNHRFQILLFENGGAAAAIPSDGGNEQLALADNRNVARAIEFLDNLSAGPGPENTERFQASDALYQALAMQPDVIYFLTDGRGGRAPGEQDLNSIKRWNTGKTILHVIHLAPNSAQASDKAPLAKQLTWLETLAKTHRGSYQRVPLAPQAAEKESEAKSPADAIAPARAAAGPPEWIAPTPATRSGTTQRSTGELRRVVVSSGPSAEDQRARDGLNQALLAAAAAYTDDVVERDAGQKLISASGSRERILQYLSTNVVKEWHNEDRKDPEFSMNDGVERFALLEFNDQSAAYFRQEWRLVVQKRRLTLLAVGAMLLLGFVGTIFGYLKTDTATRGNYGGRLKFMAGMAIIALATVAGALVVWK